MRRLQTILLFATALVLQADAFYLPGAAPRDYKRGDNVDLYVNALTPELSISGAKLVRALSTVMCILA